jgi:ribosomal protein S18 acetylase RimI-like enzyme
LIRRLGAADWALLRDVRLTALSDAPAAFGSTYVRESSFDETTWRERASRSGWFLASEGEVVHGIVAGYYDADSPPTQCHLVAMWVAPAARGTGVAIDLVEAVVGWASSDGATEVTLGVADGNERARALYRKCGFVSTGQRFPLEHDPTREIEIYCLPLAQGE